ncbi:MAG: hypothetical protein QM758_04945 [Armatimonas sp.]
MHTDNKSTKRSFPLETSVELEITARVMGVAFPLSMIPRSLVEAYVNDIYNSNTQSLTSMDNGIDDTSNVNKQENPSEENYLLTNEKPGKDYAIEVLELYKKPLHISVLAQEMKELGWPNESPNQTLRADAARNLLRRHPDIFRSDSGMWSLIRWNQESSPSKTSDLDEQEARFLSQRSSTRLL